MPVGDDQRAFAKAALEDGIRLVPQSLPWLCQQGHVALRRPAPAAAALLERICLKLGGDVSVLAAGRTTKLPGDFLHEPTGTLIEIDEIQHFTSERLLTLNMYEDTPVGYDLGDYKRLCEDRRERADRYRASKAARGFGPAGRTAQRAYYDALRDIAAPAMGHPPVVRVDSAHGGGLLAYRRHRERLLGLLMT